VGRGERIVLRGERREERGERNVEGGEVSEKFIRVSMLVEDNLHLIW